MAAFTRIEELKLKFEENPRRYFAPLANELRKSGDVSQAISICRAHLPAQPGHVSGHIVLAQALQDAGEVDEARGEFEAALEIDPENLIALRCIGDISRERGDLAEAHAWYHRVLDADPRNAEIAQLMRDLDTLPNDTPAAASPHSDLPPTPVHSLVVRAEPDGGETEISAAATGVRPEGSESPPAGDNKVAAALPAEEHPGSDADVEMRNNDSTSGTALSNGEAVASFSEPAELEFSPDDTAALSEPLEMELDATWNASPSVASFGDLEAAPQDWFVGPGSSQESTLDDPPQQSPAASDANATELEEIDALFATEPIPEMAAEDNLGPPAILERWDSVDRGSEPPTDVHVDCSAAEPRPQIAAEARDERASSGLFEKPSNLEPNAIGGRTPTSSDPVPPLAPAPFVTETLAELYLQQGFRDEALAIFRELLARNPADDALHARVAALQEGKLPAAVAVHAAPAAPIERQKASASVRTFFGRLARRERGPTTNGGGLITPTGGGSVRTPVPLGARTTTDPAPERPTATVLGAAGPEDLDSADSGSTLTQLFAAKGAAGDDVRAAGSLASAFTGGSTAAGRPARVAEGELSLDHLFRAHDAGEQSSVTMDEFYSAGPTVAKVEGSNLGKADERTADIRQFTSWLEGLKKK